MRKIEAVKFKEQCLALLEELDFGGLIVTKRGEPVARVLPYQGDDADLIGSLRHKIEVRDDLMTTGSWRES